MEIEKTLVMPGDEVPCPAGSMPGLGTYENDEGKIIANQLGYPAIYNRLVCVNPVRGRYNGETSNVIIGRISQVANKRWKVDVGANQEAVLHLSAIDLPTGEHRIRSEEDQLHMRDYFNHSDLLSVKFTQAEVQSLTQDGKAMAIQTRSSKFGKLKNGMLVIVSPMLVGRMRQHFINVVGVDIIFGRNGWIWVYMASNTEIEVPIEPRHQIVRVAAIIKLLGIAKKLICPETIKEVWEYTKEILPE
jgi:exosome complex component RRP4